MNSYGLDLSMSECLFAKPLSQVNLIVEFLRPLGTWAALEQPNSRVKDTEPLTATPSLSILMSIIIAY